MTILCLPAGTDVAEMALFDVDALPRLRPRNVEDLADLFSRKQFVQFPTEGDGGFLLHLFVNESIPRDTLRYCLVDDKLTGDFYTSAGRIAFGGMESVYADFKPNAYIRSDGLIEPGRYRYTAYQTEFPDEMVIQACRVEQTTKERWLSRAPVISTLVLCGIAIALVIAHKFVLAGMALLGYYLFRQYLRHLPDYRDLVERREHAQLAFPSIVVEFRSAPF